jgi:hypothetical protein
MSVGDGVRQGPSCNARIEPRGRVQIGTCLELEQFAPTDAQAAPFLYAIGLPDDGSIPPIESSLPFAGGGALPVQELQYRFRDVEGELFLENRGLTSSYGIFGAPGSGKTYLMLHMLRQLFSLEQNDAERRFGALILDPKAALIEDVRAIVAAVGRADDLAVVNAADLERRNNAVNVIDCDLDAYELARALVLAA